MKRDFHSGFSSTVQVNNHRSFDPFGSRELFFFAAGTAIGSPGATLPWYKQLPGVPLLTAGSNGVVGTSALPLVHATARGGTLELLVKDGKMQNNRNPKKAVPNLDIDRLMEAMSGMPCDNCDDPELVAENERLANESWEEIGYKPGAGKE